MTERTVEGIRNVLAGTSPGFNPLLFAGPAVIASIAYMDAGNFAANIQAGAKYGYTLRAWNSMAITFAVKTTQSIGNLATAAALSAFGFVVGPFIYLGHEMAWDYFGSPRKRALALPAPVRLAPV